MANRLLQLCWLFPTDCLLSHIIVKNVHDPSHLIIKFTPWGGRGAPFFGGHSQLPFSLMRIRMRCVEATNRLISRHSSPGRETVCVRGYPHVSRLFSMHGSAWKRTLRTRAQPVYPLRCGATSYRSTAWLKRSVTRPHVSRLSRAWIIRLKVLV